MQTHMLSYTYAHTDLFSFYSLQHYIAYFIAYKQIGNGRRQGGSPLLNPGCMVPLNIPLQNWFRTIILK